jgi:hypothetical protein
MLVCFILTWAYFREDEIVATKNAKAKEKQPLVS